jgi:hypothetical protein
MGASSLKIEILRRLGVPPSERGSVNEVSCPDIFELRDGRLAIIGTDVTDELERHLPADASRGPDERIVAITRETMLRAQHDISALA